METLLNGIAFIVGTALIYSTPLPLDFLFGDGELFASAGFMDLVFNRFATVYIAFGQVFTVWFVLYKTSLVMRLRAVGEHLEAADSMSRSLAAAGLDR